MNSGDRWFGCRLRAFVQIYGVGDAWRLWETHFLPGIFFFFFHLFLAMWGLCCCMGFSLVVASWCYSLAVVCRLLIAVASLCGAWVLGAQTSVVVGPRL